MVCFGCRGREFDIRKKDENAERNMPFEDELKSYGPQPQRLPRLASLGTGVVLFTTSPP